MSSRTETPKRCRYTGKERDEETGFTYHGARYYTPWLGRWTSCDPQAIAGGVNLYRYTGCRPTKLVDHTGLAPQSPQEVLVQVEDLYKKKVDLQSRITSTEQRLKRATDTAMHIRADVEASGKGGVLHYFSEEQKFLRAAERDAKRIVAELGSMTKELVGVQRQLVSAEATLREHGLDWYVKGLEIQGEHEAAAEIRKELIETTEDRFKKFAEDEAKKAGKGPRGGGGTSGGPGGGGAPPPATPHGGPRGTPPPTPASGGPGTSGQLGSEAVEGSMKLAAEGEAAAFKSGAKGIGLGGKVAKAAPWIGLGVGAFLVGGDIAERRYGRALLDAVEAVPFLGDVVIAGEIVHDAAPEMARQQAEQPELPLMFP